jgi:hypothetical protein
MKLQRGLTFLLLIALAACGSPQPAPAAPAAPAAPVATTIAPAPSATSANPPAEPAATVAPPTGTAPLATAAPPTTAPTATEPIPTETLPLEPSPEPTQAATPVPTATRPRPTPTSSGPLSAAIYVANCRSAPTAEKPGRVIVQISVEAGGGNGKYRYFFQNREFPTKFIDIPGEKGTRLTGVVQVVSGDGQSLDQPFDIGLRELNCP